MKTMCFPCYHHNGLVAAHVVAYDLGLHIAWYQLTKTVFKKLTKESNINGHK